MFDFRALFTLLLVMLVYLFFCSDSPSHSGWTRRSTNVTEVHTPHLSIENTFAAHGGPRHSGFLATLYDVRVRAWSAPRFRRGLPSLSYFLVGEWWSSPGIYQLRRCSFYTWSWAFETTCSNWPIISSGFKLLAVFALSHLGPQNQLGLSTWSRSAVMCSCAANTTGWYAYFCVSL